MEHAGFHNAKHYSPDCPKCRSEVKVTDKQEDELLQENKPAFAVTEPIAVAILSTLWAIMNDERIKIWMDNGYGSSSPDVVGGLDMYVKDAEELSKEILAKLKAMGYEQVWKKCPDCEGEKVIRWTQIDQPIPEDGMDFRLGVGVWECEKDCPTCKGTGKIYKYVPWDREEVAKWLFKDGLHPTYTSEWEMLWPKLSERDRNYHLDRADQLHKLLGGE